jgi:putative CRISPR-associated protein (TIGR02620 family)
MSHRLIVTRHLPAAAWIRRQLGDPHLPVVPHLDAGIWHLHSASAVVPPTDVFGVLPLSLAARLQSVGVRVWTLDLMFPPEKRGSDMDVAAMAAASARLTHYDIRRVVPWQPSNPHGDGQCRVFPESNAHNTTTTFSHITVNGVHE